MKVFITAILVCLATNSFAATRNIVPRATGEGGIGTSAKIWNDGYFDDATVTYGVAAATATLSSTLDVNGNVTMGADGYVSTMTAASGAWAITGAVTGLANITGLSLTASGGATKLYSRTSAQIKAIDPGGAGEYYYCSDCTTVSTCVSTGTAVADWALITNKTAACE